MLATDQYDAQQLAHDESERIRENGGPPPPPGSDAISRYATVSAVYWPRYACDTTALMRLELQSEAFPLPAIVETMLQHVKSIEARRAHACDQRYHECTIEAIKARMGVAGLEQADSSAYTHNAQYFKTMQQGHLLRCETILKSATSDVLRAKEYQFHYERYRKEALGGAFNWGQSTLLENYLNKHLLSLVLVLLDIYKLYSFRLTSDELVTIAHIREFTKGSRWQDGRRDTAPHTLACVSHKIRLLADRMCEQLQMLL